MKSLKILAMALSVAFAAGTALAADPGAAAPGSPDPTPVYGSQLM